MKSDKINFKILNLLMIIGIICLLYMISGLWVGILNKVVAVLFPFVLGIFIGVIMTVKLISFLFKYYKSKTYSAIYGFSISTIFVIGIKCLKSSYSLIELIISIVFLILGLIITKKINHYVTCD